MKFHRYVWHVETICHTQEWQLWLTCSVSYLLCLTLVLFACWESISKTMQENQMKFLTLIADNDRKFKAYEPLPLNTLVYLLY